MIKALVHACFVLVALLFVPGGAAAGNFEMIKDEIASKLTAGAPWEDGTFEIEDIRVSGLDESTHFTSVGVTLPRGVRNTGKVSVLVTLFNGPKEIKSVWASARIRVYRDAVVALRPLKMNVEIGPDDVKIVRVDVSEAQDAVTTIDEAQGQVVRRPITAGAVIRRTSLKPQVIVRRGDRLEIVVETGAIRIKSSGVASNEGALGTLIAARTSGGKEIKARVTGPGMATVDH